MDRAFQEAVDEAYRDIVDSNVIHEREEVVASWRETGTWIEPPIFLSGAVLGTAIRDHLLVGSTRLGCLRAFLDQGLVTEGARHQVWVGHQSALVISSISHCASSRPSASCSAQHQSLTPPTQRSGSSDKPSCAVPAISGASPRGDREHVMPPDAGYRAALFSQQHRITDSCQLP